MSENIFCQKDGDCDTCNYCEHCGFIENKVYEYGYLLNDNGQQKIHIIELCKSCLENEGVDN